MDTRRLSPLLMEAVVTIMFRKKTTHCAKDPQLEVARRLASLRPPMPFIAKREVQEEMAVGLRSASPLAA
jgi:hypothetical protein